ncbi:MAG: hypothetical protein ACQEXV_22215 [Bacillota bacterium]
MGRNKSGSQPPTALAPVFPALSRMVAPDAAESPVVMPWPG